MATFEEITNEIKSKVSITDAVEKYVDLKGNKASCPFPFHQDDTPSFLYTQKLIHGGGMVALFQEINLNLYRNIRMFLSLMLEMN